MIEDRFEILVGRYLVDELNSVEFDELQAMVSSNEYYQLKFKEYVKAGTLLNAVNVSSDVAFNTFLNEVEKPKKKMFNAVFKYAAVSIGVLFSAFGISNLFNTDNSSRTALVIPNEDIVLYDEKGVSRSIELTDEILTDTEESELVTLGEDSFYKVSQLKAPIKNASYTLKIPFGKKFNVILSDGTKVYLNSGSTLTYPNSFENTKNRVVTLEGEGYFEVTKNRKKPFIVNTENLNIRVLGTKFNVSAYKNDELNSVTLVEGKVAVNKPKIYAHKNSKSLLLTPNERATIKISSKKLSKNFVTDIQKYVSWKNEELVFKNDKFVDISKKLERNFNVKIISENNNLNNKEFTGKFNKQDVFEILDAFRVHTSFTYAIKNNSIVIKK